MKKINLHKINLHSYLALLSVLAISCAPVQVEAPAEPQVAQEIVKVENQHQAVKLAQRHLALKNRDWGNISGVKEDENYYRVSFETPKQELRIIGQRVILVKKENGLVSVVQRR